jgi:hypothetical protein
MKVVLVPSCVRAPGPQPTLLPPNIHAKKTFSDNSPVRLTRMYYHLITYTSCVKKKCNNEIRGSTSIKCLVNNFSIMSSNKLFTKNILDG